MNRIADFVYDHCGTLFVVLFVAYLTYVVIGVITRTPLPPLP